MTQYVHETIERASREKTVYAPQEWHSIIRSAKDDPNPDIVKKIKQEDVFDFQELVESSCWGKDVDNKKIFWSQVKEISVRGELPYQVFYKYALNGEPSQLTVYSESENKSLSKSDLETELETESESECTNQLSLL